MRGRQRRLEPAAMQASCSASVREALYCWEAAARRARQYSWLGVQRSRGLAQRRRDCFPPRIYRNHTQSPQRPPLRAVSAHWPEDRHKFEGVSHWHSGKAQVAQRQLLAEMARVPALGRRSQAQVPRARSGTRPVPPAPQIRNFLSPRSFPAACRHDHTASPPDPRHYPSIAPLIGDKRCYGGVTVRLRRGQAQDRERRERARLPQSVGAQTAGLPYPQFPLGVSWKRGRWPDWCRRARCGSGECQQRRIRKLLSREIVGEDGFQAAADFAAIVRPDALAPVAVATGL